MLEYKSNLLLAALLVLVGICGCEGHDAYLIVNIDGVPDQTVWLDISMSFGRLTGDAQRFSSDIRSPSFFLPEGTLYWDEATQAIVGELIQVNVDAVDAHCVIATQQAEQLAVYKVRQEMQITLMSVPEPSPGPCTPLSLAIKP